MSTYIYTTPKLAKGKKPVNIPKGSTLKKEWSKNVWYVNYSFNGKQYRKKEGLNRKKDADEKEQDAKVLLQSIINDLANGFNPEDPEQYIEQLTKKTILLSGAVDNYIADITKHLRAKTVQSYQSKLRYLVEAFPNKEVRNITNKDIEKYIYNKIHSTEPAKIQMGRKTITLNHAINWTPETVKNAKRIFTTFFNWCIEETYVTKNPVKDVNDKKIRSEVVAKDRHIPFTNEDNKTLMNYLDSNDKFTAFFCRMIYCTCLRPSEITHLKIKDINMREKKIVVPLTAMKNTKKKDVDIIDVEPNLFEVLDQLSLNDQPKDYYITSNDLTIVGEQKIRPDKPYKRLVKALKKLNLQGKGYNLYSFKHYSNIQRLNGGWTLAEIMKANRHSSIAMTDKYLKNISRQTDLSNKEVPKI